MNYSWYYQVSEGMITISAAISGTEKDPCSQGFTWFTLSPEKLKDLETKGLSKTELMQMDYAQAEKILQ